MCIGDWYPWKGLQQGWPLAAVWELGFGRVLTICRTDQNGSLCLNYLQKQYSLFGTPAFTLGV